MNIINVKYIIRHQYLIHNILFYINKKIVTCLVISISC